MTPPEPPMRWSMPAPPPVEVLSVRDCDGREWSRESRSGLYWTEGGVGWPAHWDWLVYNRQPLTADELAR